MWLSFQLGWVPGLSRFVRESYPILFHPLHYQIQEPVGVCKMVLPRHGQADCRTMVEVQEVRSDSFVCHKTVHGVGPFSGINPKTNLVFLVLHLFNPNLFVQTAPDQSCQCCHNLLRDFVEKVDGCTGFHLSKGIGHSQVGHSLLGLHILGNMKHYKHGSNIYHQIIGTLMFQSKFVLGAKSSKV